MVSKIGTLWFFMSGFEARMLEVDESGKLNNGAGDIYTELLRDQSMLKGCLTVKDKIMCLCSQQPGDKQESTLQYFIEKEQTDM